MAPGAASLSSCVVVSPVYCVHERTVLTLKESLWSGTGDEICITDQDGSVWFKVDPKLGSCKEERIVYDLDGVSVFSLKKKSWSVSSTWRLFRDGSFDKHSMLCDIKLGLRAQCDLYLGMNKFSGAKIKIFLNDGDSLVDYYVKGNFRSKELTIHKVADGSKASGGGDMQVAKITKRYRSLSEATFGAQTYFLEMEEGADAAFLTALAIVIDENYGGSQAKSGHSDSRSVSGQSNHGSQGASDFTHPVPVSSARNSRVHASHDDYVTSFNSPACEDEESDDEYFYS